MTNITFIHTNLKQYLYVHPEELWLHHFGKIVITQEKRSIDLDKTEFTTWLYKLLTG